MKNKRIVIFDRSDSDIFHGGDTVQIQAIKDFLIRSGYHVDIFSIPVDISHYDVVFIFNLQRPFEGLLYASLAVNYNKPYIFFPVYWDLDSLRMKDVLSMKSFIKKALPSKALFLLKSMQYYIQNKAMMNQHNVPISRAISMKKIANYILKNAQHIIVNSYSEKEHLINSFGMRFNEKTHVIYNGTDISEYFNGSDFSYLEEKYNLPQSFLCCVGAIGPRKNQHSLVRAANRTRIPLIIIGKATPNNKNYFKKIQKISNTNIQFINQLTQQEIAYILTRSRGHVQPSYIETPGLASLEAAFLNCPVCVADVGPVREYFGRHAIYVDPHNVESIRCGMEDLYACEYLKEDFDWISKFRWDNVLKNMLKYI